jgi:hypothetical protein
MGREAADAEADKLIGQGLRPELINTDIGVTTRSLKEPDRVINDNSTRSARDLYEAFEESSAYNKMTPEQQLEWANDQYGKGRSALRPTFRANRRRGPKTDPPKRLPPGAPPFHLQKSPGDSLAPKSRTSWYLQIHKPPRGR